MPSFVLLLAAVAMGVSFVWDIAGVASRMRTRLEEGFAGVLYRWLPPWTFRAFGIWCILFGIGQFLYVASAVT